MVSDASLKSGGVAQSRQVGIETRHVYLWNLSVCVIDGERDRERESQPAR